MVLITGTIEGMSRVPAIRMLERAGARYAKNLNKSVHLVVLGREPGPEKLVRIKELGMRTCGWQELIEKIGFETDESGEDPPKKRTRRT